MLSDMALTAASTDAQVYAAYDDNSSYRIDADRTKAELFVQACMILTRRLPTSAMRGEQQLTRETLRHDREEAQEWLESHPATTGETGNRIRYFATENFQGY